MRNQIKIKLTFVMVSGLKLESDFQICSKFYIYFPDDFEYCRELSRCIEYSDQKGKVFIQIDKVCIWQKKNPGTKKYKK
jgi:hypothetical protein